MKVWYRQVKPIPYLFLKGDIGMIRLLIPDTEMEMQAMEFKRQFYENGEHTICGSYIINTTLYGR